MGKAALVGATGLESYRILGSPTGTSPFARVTELSFPSLKAVQECAACRGPRRPWPTRSRCRRAGPLTS